MGGDTPSEYYKEPAGLYISLIVDSPADADRIFGALADGGRITMPIAETFFSARFGMVVDKFGTPWMINGGEKAVTGS
jgi:PhnB protein